MLTRLALVAALGALTLPNVARTQTAAVCDGSEIRRAELWRGVGRAIVIGTAVADLTAVATVPRNPGGVEKASSHYRFMLATVPVGLVGAAIAGTAYPHEGFWRRVIGRMKVGETTTGDVRRCLHRPTIATMTGTDQRWTYITAHPTVFGHATVVRTVQLNFHEGLLVDVSQTEVRHDAVAAGAGSAVGTEPSRRRGYCAPYIPVAADPFPTPTDTSAAAAAAARARADAEAAMKNAALFAAYASCMASDTAG